METTSLLMTNIDILSYAHLHTQPQTMLSSIYFDLAFVSAFRPLYGQLLTSHVITL